MRVLSSTWVPAVFFAAALILSAVLGPSGKALARRAPQDPSHPCPCHLKITKIHVHAKGNNWNVSMPPATSTGSVEFNGKSEQEVQGDFGELTLQAQFFLGVRFGDTVTEAELIPQGVKVELKGGEDLTCREIEVHETKFPKFSINASDVAGFLEIADPPFAVADLVPNPNISLKATCRVFGQTEGFDLTGERLECPDQLSDTRIIDWNGGKSNTIFKAKK
jgi:hypothetical protein